MPLVDYTSDTDSEASGSSTNHAEPAPAKKKPRTASPPRTSGPGSVSRSGSPSTLPPLPASFHDLYASTVRTTTHDNPALHQGRTRQTPHTPGTWPSHIYIEWHPPPAIHTLLSGLITTLQSQSQTTLQSQHRTQPKGSGEGVEITTLLQTPLATPQPLHISLSRPLSLSTSQKAPFLADAEAAIHTSGLAAFTLDCSRVEWHRTGESGRSFLVLRVHSHNRHHHARNLGDGGGDGDGVGDGRSVVGGAVDEDNPNPELSGLLRRCNDVAGRYGQPGLYQWAEGKGEEERQVGGAFHVSIAWSFAEPTEELVRVTEEVFQRGEAARRMREVQVSVEGVKVKIGNVVTHVGLRQPGRRVGKKGARNLLGL